MVKTLLHASTIIVVLGLNPSAWGDEQPAQAVTVDSQVHKFSELKPNYEPYGLSDHELIGSKTGAHLSGGVVFFKHKDYPWTTYYDEVLICKSVKGRFEIVINGKAQRMLPGDMVYIPEGSHVIYRALGEAVMYYAVTPPDWLKRVPPEVLKSFRDKQVSH